MDTVIDLIVIFAIGLPLYFVARVIRRGANRLVSGGSYKLEKEMTGQVWRFVTSANKENLIASIKGGFTETNPRLTWESNWICVRNGDTLGFAYGVVDITYASGTVPHVKAGMRFSAENGGASAVFNFISWTQNDGVCPYAKEMVTLTEMLKASIQSVDPKVNITVSAIS